MARKSAILEKLARLPQGSDTWLVAARELRTWVMDEEEPPYRPYGLLVLTMPEQLIVGMDVMPAFPSPAQASRALAKFMRNPARGLSLPARRPAALVFEGPALADPLGGWAQELGIEVDYEETLGPIDEVMRALESG